VSSWRNAAADLSAMLGASLGGRLLADAGFPALISWAAAVGLAGAVALALALRVAPPVNSSGASGP